MKRSNDSWPHGLPANLVAGFAERLRDIVRFISRDSRERAESFAFRLMIQADVLQDHPEIGRSVPEHRDLTIRELIFKPYRIVYRVDRCEDGRDCAGLARGARHTPCGLTEVR